jgi:type II secretory pathway component PulC
MNVNAMTNINLTQRMVLGIGAMLVVMTSLMFLYALWQWRTDWVLAHQQNKTMTVSTEDQTAKLIASIPDRHLFGQALSGSGDAPISNLQFKVTGIVKVTNGKEGDTSKAYISISGQPAKIVEVGDNLPYGVKVYDITSDTVILENDGHLEKLPLPREPLQFKAPEPVESM